MEDQQIKDSSELITFEALEQWDYPLIRIFTYDYIDDSEIQQQLNDGSFNDISIEAHWGNTTANNSPKKDNPIHPKRIAALVMRFHSKGKFDPIRIEATEVVRKISGFCVTDGHHRLRALRFLKIPSFYALLNDDGLFLNKRSLDRLRSLVK